MQKGIPKTGCPDRSEQSLFQRTAGRAGPPFEVLDLVSADAGVALLRGGDEVHGNIALVEAINVFKPGGGEKLVDGDDVLRRDLVPRRSRNVIGSEFLSVGLRNLLNILGSDIVFSEVHYFLGTQPLTENIRHLCQVLGSDVVLGEIDNFFDSEFLSKSLRDLLHIVGSHVVLGQIDYLLCSESLAKDLRHVLHVSGVYLEARHLEHEIAVG